MGVKKRDRGGMEKEGEAGERKRERERERTGERWSVVEGQGGAQRRELCTPNPVPFKTVVFDEALFLF